MKNIAIPICAILLASCNSQKHEADQNVLQQADSSKAASTKCYRYATSADTITLRIVQAGASITGNLVYKLKEKDSNKGTIAGVMRDSILIADYTFMSEGIESTRQVAFKLEGNAFMEGYGESIAQNEQLKFKNPDSLTFNASSKLVETACQ